MEKLVSGYPSDGQIKEMWEALESGDDRAVLAVLQKRRAEMETAEDIAEGDRSKLTARGRQLEATKTFHKR